MAGFQNIKALVDAYEAGQYTIGSFRKRTSSGTSQGVWFDFAYSSGNPSPQYYANTPLVSTPMIGGQDPGFFVGANQSPKNKYLRKFTISCESAVPLPVSAIICDYLMFYGFIDESTTDPLPLVNTATLPRYTDGEGVQMFLVNQGARVGGQTVQFNYTNQDGVSGRLTTPVIQSTSSSVGIIVNTNQANALAAGPFIPLQDGDTGVRSVESVQMISGADVGLFALVLAKPIATTQIRELTAAVEKDFFVDSAQIPRIEDGAALSFIVCPFGSFSGIWMMGTIETVFN